MLRNKIGMVQLHFTKEHKHTIRYDTDEGWPFTIYIPPSYLPRSQFSSSDGYPDSIVVAVVEAGTEMVSELEKVREKGRPTS